jgi:hypothetical protein
VDWYPFVPPYVEGAGWLINEPTAQGEYLAYESADFNVNIYTVNTPALFDIAAPALASGNGEARSYRLEKARRFAWTASGHFNTARQAAGERRVPVRRSCGRWRSMRSCSGRILTRA